MKSKSSMIRQSKCLASYSLSLVLSSIVYDYRRSKTGSFQLGLLLHGTGGNEQDLIPLAYELDGNAAILSPRGKVLENGITPRFFRRLAEGVFDLQD
jgi:predicted esterase